MNKQYDFSVYIGRFQPPHAGHISSAKYALTISNKLIIIVGSANSSRDVKNPFNDAERAHMILSCFDEEARERISLVFIEDRFYQNQHWISDVQDAISNEIARGGWLDRPAVALVGFKKDDTSWYLDEFSHWDKVFIDAHKGEVEHAEPINSTEIRDLMFQGRISYIKSVVSPPVYDFIKEFSKAEIYASLKEEYNHGLEYERIFDGIPEQWGRNFFTADAVVIQSGHILMVRRAEMPGKGLWALPGGHVNPDETSEQAVIRELREETSLKVPEKVLRGSIAKNKLFEHPDRSLRCRLSRKNGRTVTMAYAMLLDSSQKLPKVKGASDASEENGGGAWWFPIGDLKAMRNEMFEDHYDIAKYFIDQLD